MINNQILTDDYTKTENHEPLRLNQPHNQDTKVHIVSVKAIQAWY